MTETTKNPAKEYLRGIRGLAREERRLFRQYGSLRERIGCVPGTANADGSRILVTGSPRGPVYNGVAVGETFPAMHAKQRGAGGGDPTGGLAAAMGDAEAAHLAALGIVSRAKAKAQRYLECLTPGQREIVAEYYFEAKGWAEVAAELSFSMPTLHKRHKALLARMNGIHGRAIANELPKEKRV
ncbi:MAG: hypothetical protein LBS91_03020 [Clostridiales Family XIII bacterium]|jgi:hypothetical protein|nr:hypothetical protein [Clostridiales Family XIII bacterium]